MKKLLLLLPIALLWNCQNQATEPTLPQYHIYAEIDSADQQWVYLKKLDMSTNATIIADSAELVDGRFEMHGTIEHPYLHTLQLGNERLHVFLSADTLRIEGTAGYFGDSRREGGREDSLFQAIGIDQVFAKDTALEMIQKHPDFNFAAFAAFYYFGSYAVDQATMEGIAEGFAENVKEGDYYEPLQLLIERMGKVQLGQVAPDFTLPAVNGDSLTLSSYRGRYVLVDFWASWCGPCRRANPALVEGYLASKELNFEILGVSLDKDRDKWLEAIEADGLTWDHGSNLEGWAEPVAALYSIRAIPQNVLLDPQGVIIAKNIEGEEIRDTLNYFSAKGL